MKINILKATAALSVLLASPSFAADSNAYVAAVDAGSARWEKTSATYEVPVSDDLKDVAVFELDEVRSRARGGQKEVRYTLPIELTGVPTRITMKTDAEGYFRGPLADANCVEAVCTVKYKNLKFDESAVLANFEMRGIQGIDLDRRMQVFKTFSGDPAGIIRRRK